MVIPSYEAAESIKGRSHDVQKTQSEKREAIGKSRERDEQKINKNDRLCGPGEREKDRQRNKL